ncbi:hypothetical protein [Sinorhizobium meliloti]|uniref:hypothetical protein n=1 Tax=Rhizobium meliloti TaxID=382 RepID=UPI003EBB054F
MTSFAPRDAASFIIYVINPEGIAVAASNAGEPTSFVGIDYRRRHYFTDAMAGLCNMRSAQLGHGRARAAPILETNVPPPNI